MNKLGILILAAGLGKRMRSKRAKVLHPLCGKPLILHVVEKALFLKPEKMVVVVGHQGREVEKRIKNSGAKIAHQPRQLGTGHAALQSEKAFTRFRGDILILNGDTPLLTEATLKGFIHHHGASKVVLSLLTARIPNPSGYGRIVRDSKNHVLKIVEEKDASVPEKKIEEINSGIYLVNSQFLFKSLKDLGNQNAQGEYYLTDIVQIAVKRGENVSTWMVSEPDEVMGINSRLEFSTAEKVMRRRILERVMQQGVTVLDPSTTFIDDSVQIGQDSVLYPSTFLEGETRIGEECIIGPQVHLIGCRVGNGVMIRDGCLIENSILEDDVRVGPYAHLRPGTLLGKGARVGNFVEIKNSELGKGSKANHLSYIGDAMVGDHVNIGAGTITCNYDGFKKSKTVIEDGVFIGSDAQLVAPVRIGKGALIAAGSTVTRDVPPEAMAISRSPQENKKGWVRKRNALRKSRKEKGPPKK